MKKKKKKPNWLNISNLPFAMFTLLAIFSTFYFTVLAGRTYFHSDCTDTLYWAKASVDAGQLVSGQFKYAGLMPMGGSLLMLPFAAAFGLSMKAHIMGMVLFAILLIFTLFQYFKSCQWSPKWILTGIFVFLMAMSGSDKLREMFWQHIIYYSLGVFMCVMLLTMLNQWLKLYPAYKENQVQADVSSGGEAYSVRKKTLKNSNANTKALSLLLLIGFASLTTGVNGIQIILLTVFPICFACAVYIFAQTKVQLRDPVHTPMYIFLTILVVAVILGLVTGKLICHGVEAGYANAYSTYSAMDTWLDNLLKLPQQWLSLMGVKVKDGDTLVSFASVINMIKIGTAIWIVVMPILMLIHYKKLEYVYEKILILVHVGLCCFILFAYVVGKLSAANWRLIPIYATSVLCTLAFAKHTYHRSNRLTTLILLPLCLYGVVIMTDMMTMPADAYKENENYRLSQFLEEKNLDYGYASFWHAQSITVFSEGTIQAVNISVDERGVKKEYYQSEYSWFEGQAGQENYFLLLEKGEKEKMMGGIGAKVLEDATNMYEYEQYTIYVFDHNIPFV